MRVAKGQVISICGGTCVGKTTVARIVAETMGWEHRDCGGEVVKAARVRGESIGELGVNVHREIDEDTRALAISGQRIVIEGRYLQYVLVGLEAVRVVQLTCSGDVRSRRWVNRMGRGDCAGGVDESDRTDRELCAKLYSVAPREAHQTIDTAECSAAAVARVICEGVARWVKGRRFDYRSDLVVPIER